jgi:glycosyltransferase involved in cell wall biosynthesis
VFRQSLVFGRTREWPALAGELRGKIEMVEIPELVRSPSLGRDGAALVTLYRLIRRGRFDLVHTHSSKAGILGRVAARLAGVPRLVHTPHGHVFGGYAGRATTRVFVWLERWAARFTHRIVGLTDQEARDHLALGIGRPAQFVTIPSGIDLTPFEKPSEDAAAIKASLDLPRSACLIGTVGRLEPVKGHRYLLDAFAGLAPRFPDLHLALVGDGELLPELTGRARRSGFGDRVRFLGWRDDVPWLLGGFDLFVFPSLNEGMGRALVEAMAAGVPVVASRAGGIPEVLGGGEAGLLVEPASGHALAGGIEALLRDATVRDRLGRAGRERARCFTVDAMLGKIEALYRELIPATGGGR